MTTIKEVVITTDEDGRCVAVTRQDDEGQILSVIWEAAPEPAHSDHPMRHYDRTCPAPVPVGWQLVPVEPTAAMYMSLLDVKEVDDARDDMFNLWTAMLAAAPKPGELK